MSCQKYSMGFIEIQKNEIIGHRMIYTFMAIGCMDKRLIKISHKNHAQHDTPGLQY